jgi:hypothetical protein
MTIMSRTFPNLTPNRCKAALYIQKKTLPQVARAAGVTVRHLVYVITGQRPGSARVYEALRAELGPVGWAFAIGESDLLTCEGGKHAAA